MKGYKFLIVGGIIFAGVVVYELYKHLHVANNNHNENETSPKDDSFTTQESNPVSEPYVSSGTNVYEEREAVVNERHYEAVKVMEESLNTIFKESDDEGIVTENGEVLDKTSDELEDLLK